MKAIQKSLLALALAGAFTSANATPVDWTLTNVIFADPQNYSDFGLFLRVSGTFTYDADTNTFSNSNIVVYDSTYDNTFSGSIAASNSSSTFLALNLGINYTDAFYGGSYISVSSLTNNGGNATITGGIYTPNLYADPILSGSGTLVGTTRASAVPEPEAYAMMLAGLGLVGFAARRKLG